MKSLTKVSMTQTGFLNVVGLLVPLLLLACGCKTVQPRLAPPLAYPAGTVPQFLLVYFPYPPNGDEVLAHPVPRYRGWTDERMERDVRKFAGIGFDRVLLAVSPETFADEHKLTRIRRFVELASFVEGAPKVAFMVVDSGSETVLSRETLGSWIVTSGIRRMPALYNENGKTVLIVRDGVRCSGVKHPAVTEISAGEHAGAQWHWPSESTCPAPAQLDSSRRVVVYGGKWRKGMGLDRKGADTGVLRSKGKLLQTALWAAFSMKAPTIIVSSWNNFSRGDFVEPNDLDGSSVIDVLEAEIQRVKHGQQL